MGTVFGLTKLTKGWCAMDANQQEKVSFMRKAMNVLGLLMENGLSEDGLQKPIDNPVLRRCLTEFWQGITLTGDDKGAEGLIKFLRKFRLQMPGMVWVEDNILHLKLESFFQGGCICSISLRVEDLEAFAKKLKDLYCAEKVILHVNRSAAESKVVTVEAGTTGRTRSLCDRDGCSVHPKIEGLLDWGFTK